MRIALISDIHANYVSLEAVLADIARQGVDRVVCLGDVAATGPQPVAVLARLAALSCPVVMGNADAWLLDPQPGAGGDELLQKVEAIDQWCRQQLTARELDYIASFTPTLSIELGGGLELFCFHGSPRANTEMISATTPDEKLAKMLSGVGAAILAGGHSHVQMVRRYRTMILVNPGDGPRGILVAIARRRW